jgi:hypothetical protein
MTQAPSTSWTESERLALGLAFGFDAVLAYPNISDSILSLGRFGGCAVNEKRFVYVPEADELVRVDAVKLIDTMRKAEAKAARAKQREAARAAQTELI